MKFGICTPVANATAAQGAGWDYVEDSVPNLLQGQVVEDECWTGGERVRSSPLPNLACNGMVPAALKITGPDADPAALEAYLRTILRRARAIGVEKLVFGSGAARTIPDGFERAAGERQLVEFVRTAAILAADYGVTVVLEHLNSKEGNVLTTLSECVAMARAIDHPNLKVLVDTFHLWAEDEPVDHVREAMPLLAHVHLADLAGRVAPGEGSPPSDYRPLFRLLKAGSYSGTMSVEAVGFDPAMYGRVLDFIKAQWDQA